MHSYPYRGLGQRLVYQKEKLENKSQNKNNMLKNAGNYENEENKKRIYTKNDMLHDDL